MQGICNSSNPEPAQQQPHPQASGHAKKQNGDKQQQQQQSNGSAARGDEEARRRQRAAAAESRALKQANRGKSTTGGRSSNGQRTTENSILYPGLEAPGAAEDMPPSTDKPKREKSEWEKANAGALGSTTFNTQEY